MIFHDAAINFDWEKEGITSNLSKREWDVCSKTAPAAANGNHVLNFVHIDAIRGLSLFRTRWGRAVIPSPLFEGHARLEETTSRHEALKNPSLAIDFFAKGDPTQAFLVAMQCFNGVGIYLDTKGPNGHGIMLHGDVRPEVEASMWMRIEERVDGKMRKRYIYPLRTKRENREFWARLNGLADRGLS